ncbi:glycosyltransferase [Subtercola endophyticus]|uniref:glycosyltransferase n=1 Tax=Subtercola endophyticus TaxID=2895559 RepID=UPI001E41D802|nr:glycosyltransferase [Subtercola endophyticus]UFS60443.1 glycosyltransferase [Subtercola endophyticus]
MKADGSNDRIAGVAVVVPARNEAALIADCLRSVEEAVRHLGTRMPVVTVVVDDSSSDGTGHIAHEFDDVIVLQAPGGNVGLARARGVEHALAALAALGVAPEQLWIANTDADSTVPEHWLEAQLGLAEHGADVVIGTVRPTFAELDAEQVEAWLQLHEPGVARGDVHGANLGLRGSTYLDAAGFRPLAEHEDVDLVTRLRAANEARVVASAAAEVVTSGRLWGRSPGGFAGYLRTQLGPGKLVVR